MSNSFPLKRNVHIAILTISDTRKKDADPGGELIKKLAKANGLEVCNYKIVNDNKNEISGVLSDWLENEELDAIITTGGTGISERDVTLEAVEPFFDKELRGFGELFRYLSFTESIGTKAILSRATAGVASDKAIFVLPGSRAAVKIAMKRLVLPEIRHIIFELCKHHHPRV